MNESELRKTAEQLKEAMFAEDTDKAAPFAISLLVEFLADIKRIADAIDKLNEVRWRIADAVDKLNEDR